VSWPFGNFAVHPLLETLPSGEATLLAITEDIHAHGLREPIVLTADGGTIVDGRLRYAACKDLGVRPVFRQLPIMSQQDLCAAAVSLNMKRRHLSAGQRAVHRGGTAAISGRRCACV
jgi:hypothetical protein